MNNFGIFIFGCVVFSIVVAATFCALIASDRPDE
jgi:multidrug efflux pump subunit AcrB